MSVELWEYERIDAAVDDDPLALRDYAVAVSRYAMDLVDQLAACRAREACIRHWRNKYAYHIYALKELDAVLGNETGSDPASDTR